MMQHAVGAAARHGTLRAVAMSVANPVRESASLQGTLHLALGHGRQQMVAGHPAVPPGGSR
jgi:hypothetical protein